MSPKSIGWVGLGWLIGSLIGSLIDLVYLISLGSWVDVGGLVVWGGLLVG